MFPQTMFSQVRFLFTVFTAASFLLLTSVSRCAESYWDRVLKEKGTLHGFEISFLGIICNSLAKNGDFRLADKFGDVSGMDLKNIALDGMVHEYLRNGTDDTSSLMSEDWSVQVFQYMKFDRCDMTNAIFDNAAFYRCSFRGTKLHHAVFRPGDSLAQGRTYAYLKEKKGGTTSPVLNFRECDFTDAEIDGATLPLTLEQVKQTKNYKTGRMDGIKLPPDIQKALDEEKKAQDAQKEK